MQLDSLYGYINKAGKQATAIKYQLLYPFIEDLARVTVDKKFGFIDRSRKEIVAPVYADERDFNF